MKPILYAFLLALFASKACAAADPVEMVQDIAQHFVIPRFETVRQTSLAQEKAWVQFCASPNSQTFTALRHDYQLVSDAWADVEFIRIGPAAAELRVERFNYWLDRHDDTGRALAAMLAAKSANALSQTSIASGSVAGQGLPILERLLYGDSSAESLIRKDLGAKQRCAVGRAIAHSLSTIASAIVTDWTKPNGGAGPALMASKGWGTSFAYTREAASVMLTDLVNGLDMLKDYKLAMMYHDLANGGAARLAEDARSGRSWRDIILNFSAIKQATGFYAASASAAQKSQLDSAWNDAQHSLDRVASAQRQNDRAKTLSALKASIAAVNDLKQTEMTIIPAATGLSLGFNNLDGD